MCFFCGKSSRESQKKTDFDLKKLATQNMPMARGHWIPGQFAKMLPDSPNPGIANSSPCRWENSNTQWKSAWNHSKTATDFRNIHIHSQTFKNHMFSCFHIQTFPSEAAASCVILGKVKSVRCALNSRSTVRSARTQNPINSPPTEPCC